MPPRRNLPHTAITAGIGELAGAVPGGSTALAIIQGVFGRRAEQRARDLFHAIAVETGANDWEAAAARLAPHVGQTWFDEIIEAGFRELMDCTDVDVRACIAVLVAEYVISQQAPDLRFRRVGAVLQDSNHATLATLLSISDAYLQVASKEADAQRVLIRGTHNPDTSLEFWIGTGRIGATEMAFSSRLPVPNNLDECTRTLVGAGIGNLWAGFSSATFGGDPIVYFSPTEDDALALLSRCLHPWASKHVSSSEEEPSWVPGEPPA